MIFAYSYIRFSTAEQAKGDSLRRQIELREQYLTEKNLRLDETLTMKDLGVSAFKGVNADEGALGIFLQAIDEGRVPQGSFLLVESLDRLSRASVDVALQLFLRIIGKGVTIVTLEDQREYSQSSIKANFTDLIVSIAIMARAHEESQRKSNLISKAWKQKRVEAAKSGKVMSRVVPFWLRVNDDRTGFVVIDEKAKLIRRMFELSLDGVGVNTIAKMMNAEGALSPNGKAWRGANVAKFLRNRAVIGEATFSSFMGT